MSVVPAGHNAFKIIGLPNPDGAEVDMNDKEYSQYKGKDDVNKIGELQSVEAKEPLSHNFRK